MRVLVRGRRLAQILSAALPERRASPPTIPCRYELWPDSEAAAAPFHCTPDEPPMELEQLATCLRFWSHCYGLLVTGLMSHLLIYIYIYRSFEP